MWLQRFATQPSLMWMLLCSGAVFSQLALLLPVPAGYISGPGDCIRGSWHLCCYCHALHHRHTHAESTRQLSSRQHFKQQQVDIWGWHNSTSREEAGGVAAHD
jgi:hypothetical protein